MRGLRYNRVTMRHVMLFALISLLLAGCRPEASAGWGTAVPEGDALSYAYATQTSALQEPATAQTAPSPSPTEDTRLKPEDWQDWPVIPDATGTARALYRQGIAMGNDPHAFSKVGDCQNVRTAFLGFFDRPGWYEQMSDMEPLEDTIANFKGHFNRDGQATQFGFTAASVLSPMMADPDICLPDENPLECELRITRPTFVLISLEFPFLGRTEGLYERYMRQIIEYTMAQGAVPILATKADNVEKDHSINLTTARLAYEYDLPLWNWWAAAQTLGNKGIDPYRDDGLNFHITEQAWNVRSKTFLQTLDHLWESLRED